MLVVAVNARATDATTLDAAAKRAAVTSITRLVEE
jgi:hypothetical protein